MPPAASDSPAAAWSFVWEAVSWSWSSVEFFIGDDLEFRIRKCGWLEVAEIGNRQFSFNGIDDGSHRRHAFYILPRDLHRNAILRLGLCFLEFGSPCFEILQD